MALLRASARLQAALLLGAGAGWGAYQAAHHPLHLVWDLDHTLLLSITPLDAGQVATATAKRAPDTYFDQIDDDFPFTPDVPNTRTCWRPGAHAALRFCGLFATQHVFTAGQATYCSNIIDRLDPEGSIFATITHRDMVPHHDYHTAVPVGKDLTRVPQLVEAGALPCRTILFDDRLANFTPQPRNGLAVAPYTDVGVPDWELARLCLVAFLALLAPDIRPVLQAFRSREQDAKFPS
eukprot:jgi/Tetstr1/434629/TSEL_023720.t1